MPIHRVESLGDPRLAAYRNLKEKELARDGDRFIAESENVVRRLLASKIAVESVLVAQRKLAGIAPLAENRADIFYGDDALIEQVIGFDFHSGVLACGIRPQSPSLADVMPPEPKPANILICQEIANTDNLGSLIRVAAALGADAMILGERCCDPFFRQSVRVSMGSVFSLPIVLSKNLLRDLHELKDRWHVERWAAVLEGESLSRIARPARVAVAFGNEAQGLDALTIAHCDRRVTIPMHRGTDSLNVAIAAAVFLYELTVD
jgi:tRNA G18 (ribose-2'-O)-methylase SpoU